MILSLVKQFKANPLNEMNKSTLALILNHLEIIKLFRSSESDLEKERIDFIHITSACISITPHFLSNKSKHKLHMYTLKKLFNHLIWLERIKEPKETSNLEQTIKIEFLETVSNFISTFLHPSKQSNFFDIQRNRYKSFSFTKNIFLLFAVIFEDTCHQLKMQNRKNAESFLPTSLSSVFGTLYSIVKQQITKIGSLVMKDILPVLLWSHEICKEIFLRMKFVPLLKESYREQIMINLTSESLDTNHPDQKSQQSHFYLQKFPIFYILDGLFKVPILAKDKKTFSNLKPKAGNQIIAFLNEIFEEVNSHIDIEFLNIFLDVLSRMIMNPSSSLILHRQMIKTPPKFINQIHNHLKIRSKSKSSFFKRKCFLEFIKRSMHCRYLRKLFCKESSLKELISELDSLFRFEFDNGHKPSLDKENKFTSKVNKRSIKRYMKSGRQKQRINQLSEVDALQTGNARSKLLVKKFYVAEYLIQILLNLSFYEPFHKLISKLAKKNLVSIMQNLRLYIQGNADKIIHLNISTNTFKSMQENIEKSDLSLVKSNTFFKFYIKDLDKESVTNSMYMNLMLIGNLCLDKSFKGLILSNDKFMQLLISQILQTNDAQLQCLISQVSGYL
jgi:hypothetical protein